jgi:hypothetical protein
VVWQLIEASVGHTDQEGLRRTVERIASLGRAAVYAVLGLLAVRVAVGAGTGGGSGEETLTARLLGMPGGQLLVGLVAAGVVGVGIGLVYRGVSGSFLDHLSPRGRSGELGRAVTWLGRAGYGGKGIAICLVGALFAWAAVTFDPDKAGGLDEALANAGPSTPRAGSALRDRCRDRVLRSVLLRPGTPSQGLTIRNMSSRHAGSPPLL